MYNQVECSIRVTTVCQRTTKIKFRQFDGGWNRHQTTLSTHAHTSKSTLRAYTVRKEEKKKANIYFKVSHTCGLFIHRNYFVLFLMLLFFFLLLWYSCRRNRKFQPYFLLLFSCYIILFVSTSHYSKRPVLRD